MSNISDREGTQSAADGGLRAGWLPDAEMAKARGKAIRAQREERQRGEGPPWTRDGREVFYNIEGYRKWLAANERSPVREPQARPLRRINSAPQRPARKRALEASA
jgi:hypothetical protein